jgi:hypothetical protein
VPETHSEKSICISVYLYTYVYMQIDRQIDRQIAFSECASGTVFGNHSVDTSIYVYMDICRYIHSIYMQGHISVCVCVCVCVYIRPYTCQE